jgi:hypothetical protein
MSAAQDPRARRRIPGAPAVERRSAGLGGAFATAKTDDLAEFFDDAPVRAAAPPAVTTVISPASASPATTGHSADTDATADLQTPSAPPAVGQHPHAASSAPPPTEVDPVPRRVTVDPAQPYVRASVAARFHAFAQRTGWTNTEIVFAALEAQRSRLGDLVAASRPQSPQGALFPPRQHRRRRSAADEATERLSIRPTSAERAILDTLAREAQAGSVSQLIDLALDAWLPRLPKRRGTG